MRRWGWQGAGAQGAGRSRERESFLCADSPEKPLESFKEGWDVSRVLCEGNLAGPCVGKGPETARKGGRTPGAPWEMAMTRDTAEKGGWRPSRSAGGKKQRGGLSEGLANQEHTAGTASTRL